MGFALLIEAAFNIREQASSETLTLRELHLQQMRSRNSTMTRKLQSPCIISISSLWLYRNPCQSTRSTFKSLIQLSWTTSAPYGYYVKFKFSLVSLFAILGWRLRGEHLIRGEEKIFTYYIAFDSKLIRSLSNPNFGIGKQFWANRD